MREKTRFASIYTLYMVTRTPEEVLDFCRRSGVRFITMWNHLLTPEIVDTWEELGIRIGVHTVNKPETARQSLALGADMIYTDFIIPADVAR